MATVPFPANGLLILPKARLDVRPIVIGRNTVAMACPTAEMSTDAAEAFGRLA